MGEGAVLLVFVTLQRFGEFIWDRQNTTRLLAAGAVEVAPVHTALLLATRRLARGVMGAWL